MGEEVEHLQLEEQFFLWRSRDHRNAIRYLGQSSLYEQEAPLTGRKLQCTAGPELRSLEC